jgi:hypothetical protein
MQNPVNKFILQSDEMIQTRRAQTVDPQLAGAIRQACTANSNVIACYLLDARKPNTNDIVLIIAVTVEDETKNIDLVAQQLWEMLQRFPTYLSKTFIMSSVNFRDRYFGSEFYIRQ